MRKVRDGFTILEIILVLAISTLLFMSISIGLGQRISTSRYETAVNEAAEYFRGVYSAVLNTENTRFGTEGIRNYCTLASAAFSTRNEDFFATPNTTLSNIADNREAGAPGRSDCAIYGKLLLFGAEDNTSSDNTAGRVFVFDVVGEVISPKKDADGTSQLDKMQDYTTIEALSALHADYLAAVPENPDSASPTCYVAPAGSYTTYQPSWGTKFTTADYGDTSSSTKDTPFVGMVMIVRSPITGNVSTFFAEQDSVFYKTATGGSSYTLNDLVSQNMSISCSGLEKTSIEPFSLSSFMSAFSEEQRVDGFCMSSDDFYVAVSNRRKFIRFIPNGQNASAVKLIESDVVDDTQEDYNPCARRG